MGLLTSMIGHRLAPTALGMLGMLASLLTAVLSFSSGYENHWTNVVAFAMFLVGVVWLAVTEAGALSLRSPWLVRSESRRRCSELSCR